MMRAKNGDARAVDALTKSLRPRISKMAVYYGRQCGEDPDDLLQEAWLGLLEALPKLDLRIGTPEQYLIARARWRMLDFIKRARVRRCSPLEDEPVDRGHADDTAVAAVCASDFVRRLTETQRTTLSCLMSGLTWREAGEVMGCASANVAYHVRKIRQRYEEWVGSP